MKYKHNGDNGAICVGSYKRMMKKTEKSTLDIIKSVCAALGRIVLILLIAVLAFTACALAYDRFIKKSDVPSLFGYSLLVIATSSMSGTLDAGDAVIIKKEDSYVLNDVVTYFPQGESVSVTHRIVRTEGDRFYTKGDANNSEDPDPVYAGQIVGKVMIMIPQAGFVIEWLRTSTGIVFVVAVTFILIAIGIVASKTQNFGVLYDAQL